MKYVRVAGLFTASGLIALLVATLFGQTTTSSPSTAQPAADGQAAASLGVARQAAPVNPPISPDLDTIRALRRAGLTDAAMSELRRWIQQNPKMAIPTDIKELLANLDDNGLDVARANRDVGLLDSARMSLQQWIQQHPKSPLPKDLANLLPGPIDNSLQVARAYKKTHLLDLAAAELQTWIQRHPESTVPDDLKDLLPGRFDVFSWWFRHHIAPSIVPVLEALGVLVLIVLILLRWVRIGRPFLVIGDFDSSGMDAAVGKRIAALVRQQLAAPRSASLSLTIATGPVEPTPVPAEITSGLSSAIPMAQTLSAVLRWASPKRVVTITGLVHPPGRRGVGVTLIAGENQRTSQSVTIWQRDFEPDVVPVPAGTDAAVVAAQQYDSLITPGATWLQFHMQNEYGSHKKSSFQTRDWRSRAAFEAGLRLEALNCKEAAQKMYLKALGHDPKNLAARVNMALLLPLSNIREQIELLKYVAKESKGQTGDSTYYSAAFSLAMALVVVKKNREARNVAKELVGQITIMQARFERTWIRKLFRSTDNSTLEKYLRVVAPSARVIAAALADEALPKDLDKWWPSTEFQYNLASYYSMREGKENLTTSLKHLEFAATLNQSKVASQATADAKNVFRNLSTSPRTRAGFAKIIAPPEASVAPPAAHSVLASLIVIGPERTAVLLSHGVATPTDLFVKCSTFTAAKALADSVGVKLPTLLRWARVAELTRLTNIQPAHINSLTLAGRDSLAAIRGVSPATLAVALQDWRSDTASPSADTINAWALEIMNTPSIVFQDSEINTNQQ
jgi:tetratricopeptide (TPR) repeat protein